MSQSVITNAFEQLKAQQAANGSIITLDEFVFANIPGLDTSLPISRDESWPEDGQIVHRQAVGKTGMVNANAVAYSAVLGADVGDFEFNWIGLVSSSSDTVCMIVHAPLQKKIKTAAGQQGNVLTRSFLMEYSGASEQTAIVTPVDTWQIDFTSRLNGVDERIRLENVDVYGAASFINDGFKVSQSGTVYSVKRGIGYVAGIRSTLLADQELSVISKPTKVWVDVCWKGTLTSVWAEATKLTLADTLENYSDSEGQHYVYAIAHINADGSVNDLRPATLTSGFSQLAAQKNTFPFFNSLAEAKLAPLSDFVRGMMNKDDSSNVLSYLGMGDVLPKQQDISINVPGDFPSVSAALKSLRNKRFPAVSVVINVSAGIYTEAETLPTAHVDGDRVSIVGKYDDLAVSSVNSVTAGKFTVRHWDGVTRDLNYHTVTGTVSGKVPAVGEFVLIQSGAGNDKAEYHVGAWEVTAVAGNQVTWVTTLNAAPPSGAVTLSGKILRSVIRFADGAKGPTAIRVESSLSLGLIDGLAIVGAATPVVMSGGRSQANYDVYGDAGGNTGVVSRDGGVVNIGSNFGISGFSGSNVYANRNGTIIVAAGAASSNSARNGWGSASGTMQCTGAISSGNLIDGFIAQDTAFTFATSAKSFGHHRHAYIAAGGGSVHLTGSVGKGSLGNGLEVINSQALANNAVLQDNTGKAINLVGGAIRAPSCDLRNNNGVTCSLNGSLNITSSNLDGVTVTAESGGYIDVTGYNGTATMLPVVNHYAKFGEFIASGTSQTFIGFSPSGTNSAMRISDTNHVLIGSATDLAGQAAARLHVNGAAVFAGTILPATDANINAGSASLRFNIGFFAGGTQSTSDATLKDPIRDFTRAELNAAMKVAKQFGFWTWLDDEQKRLRAGTTVQSVLEVLKSEGLDWQDYGFIGFDEWDDVYTPEVVALDDGSEVETGKMLLVRAAGSVWQLRDQEFDRFVMRGLSERISVLEQRIGAVA
uniref:phage tail-collar fiber domain-containing protein n=1 Tax=Type-E symbiont of Plautia stali TaxID=1560357 RepID=UPI00073F257E|nr:phage tail protein [Type-E symbiont of Plautia stali]